MLHLKSLELDKVYLFICHQVYNLVKRLLFVYVGRQASHNSHNNSDIDARTILKSAAYTEYNLWFCSAGEYLIINLKWFDPMNSPVLLNMGRIIYEICYISELIVILY